MLTLSKIPGQATATRNLLNSFTSGRLASTYLFYGADGRGKWATAIALAALVNCESPRRDGSGKVLDSCGDCRNCRQIANLSFPDLYFALPIPAHRNVDEAIVLNREYLFQKCEEPFKIISTGLQLIEPINEAIAGNKKPKPGETITPKRYDLKKAIAQSHQLTIPIDVARDLKRHTIIGPPTGVKRVIIFYQMEKMLSASADALLKMIEEPPPQTIIIMTVVDPNDLLPTIKSRAQRIRFRPISAEDIADYLIEKRNIGSEKASFAAHLADGSLGQALNYIDDDDNSSGRQTSFLLFKEILTKDTPSAISALSELLNPNDRGEAELIIHNWQSFLSDIIRIKHGENLANIMNLDLSQELEKLSARFSLAADFAGVLDNLKKMNLSLRRNIHVRAGMVAMIFEMRKYINQNP